MKYWFTSDYHLGHANIIKYCERPFANVEEMNKVIIRNHNSRVKLEDTVFFIGDFCFKNTVGGKEGEGNLDRAEHYLKQLNGRFVFIQGNHDSNNSLKTCIKGVIIKLGGEELYLTHIPENFNHNFKLNLVGHVHEAWKIKKVNKGKNILVNVGVDVWRFMPIKIEEIFKAVAKDEKNNN